MLTDSTEIVTGHLNEKQVVLNINNRCDRNYNWTFKGKASSAEYC